MVDWEINNMPIAQLQWKPPFIRSSKSNLNFLLQDGTLFYMDNHLAASWCWWRICDMKSLNRVNIMHIDWHYDFGPSSPTRPPAGFRALSLTDYLACKFTFDNYFEAFLREDSP